MTQQTSPFTRKALCLRAPQDAHSDELPPKAIRRACAQPECACAQHKKSFCAVVERHVIPQSACYLTRQSMYFALMVGKPDD